MRWTLFLLAWDVEVVTSDNLVHAGFVHASPHPTRMNKGAACVLPFSRERGYFGPFVSGRFSREKLFQKKFPEKLRKRGYELYVHVFRAFNSLPRKDVGPLLYCISVVGPPMVMVKYVNIFPEPREKKGNRGHHDVPEVP